MVLIRFICHFNKICGLKLIVRLLLFLLCFFPLTKAQQYNFKRYSVQEGLPRAGVYCIYEDRDGFLWIGVEGGGVAVFNGAEFTTYNSGNGLGSDVVRVIYESRDGAMWFGTQGDGVTRFDGKSFSQISTTNGLSNDVVRSITQDNKGFLWFGTFGGGVCRYDNKTKQIKVFNASDGLADDVVRFTFADPDGSLWFGTDGGLSKFDGVSFQNFTTKDGLPHNRILHIFKDNRGHLWIGTENGLAKMSGGKFKVYTTSQGLIHNRVKAIAQDQNGNMWFGTKEGVSKFDGKSFFQYTHEQGLSNDRIRSIITDSEGNLWFGTHFGGICKYRSNSFMHFNNIEGLNNNQVHSIFQDTKGHILFGSVEGVVKLRFNEGQLSTIDRITTLDGLNNDEVHATLKDSYGRYWYGTEAGITVFNKNTPTRHITTENGLTSNKIRCFYQEDSSFIWVGTENGATKIDIRKKSLPIVASLSTKDGLKGKKVYCIFGDQSGNIWLGMGDGGVNTYKNGKLQQLKIPEKLDHVYAIHEDQFNTVWIATHGNGLFTYAPETGRFNYPKINFQISSKNLNAIIFDDLGRLWLASEKGLDLLRVNARGQAKFIRYYNKEDGFTGIETNPGACFKDRDGNIWFGTIAGATRFNWEEEEINNIEPRTHITKVQLNYRNINWGESKYCSGTSGRFGLPLNLVLPYNENHITFQFIGISLNIPSKVKYRWQLKGADEKLSPPQNKTEITYSNLAPGKYTFVLWSCNDNGDWNKTPQSFAFTITPPFWQTAWFYFFVFVCLLLFVYVLFRWRVRSLQQARDNLKKQVDERTLELRKEKELVEIQNTEIGYQKEQLEQQRDELNEKNTSITDSIQYAKRIQSAIMQPISSAHKSLKDKLFILYEPKDIVSGDFFWFAEIDQRSIVAAADCTGHGVPGAFMSMIGITFLNELVREGGMTEPDEILNELRKSIMEALHNEHEESKDGMDIALCSIDWKNNRISYSGANNPMYLIRKGELIETKADKMPIGSHDHYNRPFTKHDLSFVPGDTVYLFSDGYADQFGGQKGKKFLVKNFKSLLLSIQNKPITEQEVLLKTALHRWMGETEQVDDILVIGIQF